MKLFARLRRRLFIFQIFLLLAGSCAVAFGALRTFEHDLEPDITRKGELIARALSSQLEHAVAAGFPFDRLRGVEKVLQSVRAANPEISFAGAADDIRSVRYFVGRENSSRLMAAIAPQLRRDLTERNHAENFQVIHLDDYLVITTPIRNNEQSVGLVLIGIDLHFVQQMISNVFYDVLVVLLVSLLLTLELLLLIMENASAPMQALQSVFGRAEGSAFSAVPENRQWPAEMRGIAANMKEVVSRLQERYRNLLQRAEDHPINEATQQAMREAGIAFGCLVPANGEPAQPTPTEAARHSPILVRVRMPLFVFFCAEELSRPFFPIFARSVAGPLDGMPPEVVVSLPMMVFMLVVAFAQPLAGPWVERLGARRLMLIGAVVGAVGLALTAGAQGFADLLAWRLLTAAGYGVVFVAGQGYVVANTDSRNRAWGLAMFVGAVLAASICGPAIGGILADRIGYRATFLVGAGVAIIAGLLATKLLCGTDRQANGAARGLRLRDIGVVLRNRKFVALIALGAMPAKIILTGFLYYLVPLYLAQLGNSQSAAGRMMMLYGLMMVLMTPIAANIVDKVGRPLWFVVAGGLLSGVGLLGVVVWEGTAMVTLGIVVLGVAQAISITPQLSLVPVACADECRRMGAVTVIGFFRLFERIGSALGPVLAALLLEHLGYVSSIAAIGCGVGVCCLLLAVVWRTQRRPSSLASAATASENGTLAQSRAQSSR